MTGLASATATAGAGRPSERAASALVDFRTDPSRYRHWQLSFDGPIATLTMDVDERGGL